jgi:hypothetical protein
VYLYNNSTPRGANHIITVQYSQPGMANQSITELLGLKGICYEHVTYFHVCCVPLASASTLQRQWSCAYSCTYLSVLTWMHIYPACQLALKNSLIRLFSYSGLYAFFANSLSPLLTFHLITGIIPTLSLYTHIYIASLFYSYSINSVLHSPSPTIRDSYEPGFAYCIAKLLKFTHTTAIALASLYRSLTQNILRLLRIHWIRWHYCNLAILIISTHFLSIELAIKLLSNCFLI